MKKKEIIDYLETNKVKFKKKDKYQILLQLYYAHQKLDNKSIVTDITVTPTNRDTTTVDNKVTTELPPEIAKFGTIRANLIVDIIKFMNSIKGKTRASFEEINKMFYLYNNFYKRAESPTCQICIGNVHTKLKMIHKKYSTLLN